MIDTFAEGDAIDTPAAFLNLTLRAYQRRHQFDCTMK